MIGEVGITEGDGVDLKHPPFWRGNFNGNSVQGKFQNCEPNNSPWFDPVNGEDYLQISQGSSPAGSWNDLHLSTGLQPTGYVRETDQASLQQQSNEFSDSFEIANGLNSSMIKTSPMLKNHSAFWIPHSRE